MASSGQITAVRTTGGMATQPVQQAAPSRPRATVSSWRLMSTFALVGLCAFGGVMPWVYRAVVEKARWLDESEFAELWSMCTILPGATSTNVAATLGYRLGGMRGAAAAAGGLLAPPFVIVLFLAALYNRFGMVPAVHGAVRGITAVAAGLTFATALKLGLRQPRKIALPLFALAAFTGITILGLPLLGVVGALVPFSLLMEWRSVK
jgi:chromate transporter